MVVFIKELIEILNKIVTDFDIKQINFCPYCGTKFEL